LKDIKRIGLFLERLKETWLKKLDSRFPHRLYLREIEFYYFKPGVFKRFDKKRGNT